jgi:hypothetical protein
VQAAPMARLQQGKQAAVTTGSARTSDIPCAMVYGLYVLSPETGYRMHTSFVAEASED